MSMGLIVELDPLFLGGFALPAELLSERLEKYGILDTDPYRFVRKLYGKPFTKALAELLPKGIDVAHVERRLAATYTALLQQNAQTVMGSLEPIFKPLVQEGVRLAVITRLSPAIVGELFESMTSDVTAVFDPLPLAIGLQPETLQSALVALGLPIRHCLGLFACGGSVRSSVRIGLRAVAVPDPMVAFENCAGATFVADQMTKTFISKLHTALLAKR
jgi:hypothetical protein